MRTLLQVWIDTAAGNRAIASGSVEKILGELAGKLNPEAAYFFDDKGRRSAQFVFDLQDTSQIPSIVEPLFQELEAEVELHPVMNLEDLQKGLAALG
jgi:hypothetical protein